MKTIKKSIFAVILYSLMAFPGCQVVGIDSIEDNPSAGDKTVTITANIAGSTDTKVSLTPDTDAEGHPIVKVDWKESGEKFYVFGKDGEAKEFIQVSGNVFEGVMPEPFDDGACVAVYNLEAAIEDGYYHNQTGTLDEKYVYMEAIFDAQFESITFEHMTYIMKTAFKYNGNPLQNITSVKIAASDGTGDFELSLTPAEGKDCFDDGIYVHVPCSTNVQIDDRIAFKVVADGKEYEGNVPVSDEFYFELGKFYTATINLEEKYNLPDNIPYLAFNTAEGIQKLNYSGTDLEYSTDKLNWTAFNSTTDNNVEFGNGTTLYLRGKENADGTNGAMISFESGNLTQVSCTGDIRTLIDYENYETVATGSAKFNKLFYQCKVLTSVPDLPATDLAAGCYEQMFYNCAGLTSIPENLLPAMTLSENCYKNMFYWCEKLQSIPANLLPAENLATSCYEYMFGRCNSLQSIPANLLPVMTLSENCYKNMFYWCENLQSIPANLLPAENLATSCYEYMFGRCNSLQSIPANLLPAENLAAYCYANMFNSCTNLMNIPENLLPAENLAAYCYYQMFYYCTNLKNIPENLLPATNLEERCYMSMFMNSGITSLNANLLSKATKLASSCFSQMFCNCASLKTIEGTLLTADAHLAPSCCVKMFEECKYLKTVPKNMLPANTMAENCYQFMFNGCQRLQIAPDLPATTLADYCYNGMFCDCHSLQIAPDLPAKTLAASCYARMFCRCYELTTAPVLRADKIEDGSYSYMFEDCSCLTEVHMYATQGSFQYNWLKFAGKSKSIPNDNGRRIIYVAAGITDDQKKNLNPTGKYSIDQTYYKDPQWEIIEVDLSSTNNPS